MDINIAVMTINTTAKINSKWKMEINAPMNRPTEAINKMKQISLCLILKTIMATAKATTPKK